MVWTVMAAGYDGGCHWQRMFTGHIRKHHGLFLHSADANSKRPQMTPRQVQAQVIAIPSVIIMVSVASRDLARTERTRKLNTAVGLRRTIRLGRDDCRWIESTANLLHTRDFTLHASLGRLLVPKVIDGANRCSHLYPPKRHLVHRAGVLSPANQKELADIIQRGGRGIRNFRVHADDTV